MVHTRGYSSVEKFSNASVATEGTSLVHSGQKGPLSISKRWMIKSISVAVTIGLFSFMVSAVTLKFHHMEVTRDMLTPSGAKRTKANHLSEKAQSIAALSFANQLYKPTLNLELSFNERMNENDSGATVHRNGTDAPFPPPEGCEATLMILRHCEGGAAREHCGHMGYQRSKFLATLFGEGGKWPAPSYLFATAADERHNPIVRNWREIETVEPLAKKFNLTVNQSYGYPEKKDLATHLFSLLRSGEMCGKLAVLSWKHHDIPNFSHTMGCGPVDGCPVEFDERDFDSVWQISYSYHKEKHAPYVIEDLSAKGLQKRRPWGQHPKWFVYGTIRYEAFDPLEFGTMMGIYLKDLPADTKGADPSA